MIRPGIAHHRRLVPWYVALATVAVLGGVALGGEVWADELDCHVYDTRSNSITLGLKAGNFLFQVGPEVTFGTARGIAWDKVVQGIIARYKEACTRYNAGMISKEEYAQRLREIDGLYREALELERKLQAETHAHARSMHDEMERALAGRQGASQGTQGSEPDSLGTSLAQLGDRIEALEQIGRPLTPKPPCPPPDMLGAPGAQGDSGRKC
ncbi:MAG: hypothetical protein E8D45_07355 [Nitrospira sp.]|nr:MAG: hypothetical protein E8D45_07355 [Nitrospira sp.]